MGAVMQCRIKSSREVHKGMDAGTTNIGKTIRTLREVKGMTRLELSEAAGISESLMNSTDEQALFMTGLLEFVARNIGTAL